MLPLAILLLSLIRFVQMGGLVQLLITSTLLLSSPLLKEKGLVPILLVLLASITCLAIVFDIMIFIYWILYDKRDWTERLIFASDFIFSLVFWMVFGGMFGEVITDRGSVLESYVRHHSAVRTESERTGTRVDGTVPHAGTPLIDTASRSMHETR